jgi:hypothetical protein
MWLRSFRLKFLGRRNKKEKLKKTVYTAGEILLKILLIVLTKRK